MSTVPQIIFSGGGVIVAAIGFYVRRDPQYGRATPFLLFLGLVCVGLAVLLTFAG